MNSLTVTRSIVRRSIGTPKPARVLYGDRFCVEIETARAEACTGLLSRFRIPVRLCLGYRWGYSARYESESEHPPANLLADLARVLNLSTDQLLTDAPVKRQAKATLSPRLGRRLKHSERLSPKSKQQLLTIIDTFIEAEALKQRSAR
jgi:hypothetical protein